ncbi:MAG: TrmB family transcriptional regulator [Candidatus Thorarchaeota archaeon]
MAEDTIVENLLRLGLTINESKAYKALVGLGPSSARRIAEVSAIPRSKVYETLGDLEKRGIVLKDERTSPTTYDAVSPDVVVTQLEGEIIASSASVRKSLATIEQKREAVERKFVWTNEGQEQITSGLIEAINNAENSIFIATRSPHLLSPLRSAFSRAKNRGVKIELHTTKMISDEFEEFKHYLEIHDAIPSSEILMENMQHILSEVDFSDVGWNPDAMSVIVIDMKHSVAVFLSSIESQKPWSLHISNPLIVIIQWQVIKTALGAVEGIIASMMKQHLVG